MCGGPAGGTGARGVSGEQPFLGWKDLSRLPLLELRDQRSSRGPAPGRLDMPWAREKGAAGAQYRLDEVVGDTRQVGR